MEFGVDAAKAAWARLIGLSTLTGTQVVIDPESWLAPHGWIGVLVIRGTITASVPRPELEGPVASALRGLTSDEATTPAIVSKLLPPTRATLGPAALFYPPSGFKVSGRADEEATSADLAELLSAASVEDLDESGILHIESPPFVSRSTDGHIASASGYRRWPNGVAHLSVLTDPSHRQLGHGRRAASLAVHHAIREGLLPQWRARPIPSQQLAKSLGLVEVGAQLSLQLA